MTNTVFPTTDYLFARNLAHTAMGSAAAISGCLHVVPHNTGCSASGPETCKGISVESAIANFEGLELTQDGFVLMPSRKDRRIAQLVVLFVVALMGGLNAIAISTGHVAAVAITASFGIFFVFVAWFTTKPPVFALSGQQITLLGNVQRMRMSKSELEGVRRGRSTDRAYEKTYWLHKKDGPTNFYVYVRHFDPGALEEAIGLLGVEVTGDFSS